MKYKTPILLIEDNPGDVELVREYLKESAMTCDLFHADTLYEGIDILQTREIELVLLDLSLPDTSGFKTLTKYLEQAGNIPVIILTGMNNEIVGNQAIKAGAQDFLVKGQFDGKLLGRAIRYGAQRFKTQEKLEQTARQLEIHKKRYVEAQEMARFGNWEMDIVTNEMKWTSEVYRVFGFQPGSLAPSLSDYMSYVHREDREKVDQFFENASKDGKLHNVEHRLVLDGTSIKHLAVQAKVFYDELTEKILLVGGVQDITERKVSEKLIIEKNISTKAASIKEEALSEMGFHIRTPLSSIVNLLYLMENTPTSPQQREFLGGLKTSVDDLSMAINNLLNFSVLVSDNVKVEEEEIVIKDFLQSIKKSIKLKADNAKLNLNFDTDDLLPEKIISDHKKIIQILYNLIDNAIKFSNEEDEITVETLGKNVQGSSMNLVFRIKDTGVGMSSGQVKKLMEADKLLEVYNEEEEAPQKRKLGVAIVAKLTKTLGGELNIESEEGEGSSFTISIPVKIVKRTQISASDKPEMPLKILLVEDHFLNQIAHKKVLTTWSDFVTVDIAENGLIAVEKFREHGYDIILMDLQMPVMNGIDSARRIREFSDVPIIALTANSTKQEQDKCFETGMNDYLAKPFKPQDLHYKIMSLVSMVMN